MKYKENTEGGGGGGEGGQVLQRQESPGKIGLIDSH